MKRTKWLLPLMLVMMLLVQSATACTIVMVGKGATVDGSTITTHNDVMVLPGWGKTKERKREKKKEDKHISTAS